MLGLGNTLSRQSTPLSSAPVGLDKTFSFDSDLEGWIKYGYGSISQVSNVEGRFGILSILKLLSTSFTPSIAFDFSTLADYDNTLPLYYEIVFFAPSDSTFTGINLVRYGANGDESTHTVGSQGVWSTVSGELINSGADDEILVELTPNPSGVTPGDTMFIDSMRFSHTDFR